MKFSINNNYKVHIIHLICITGVLFGSFSMLYSQDQNEKYEIVVEFDQMDFLPSSKTELNDTMIVGFNLIDNRGTEFEERIITLSEKDSIQVDVKEFIGNNEEKRVPEYIPGSLKKLRTGNFSHKIHEDITISLLIDRSGSINQNEMNNIRSAVEEFAENIPEGQLYYSWFHDDISESYPVTLDNFEELDFSKSNKNTALYNAIYTKLLEFDSASLIPNDTYEQDYQRNLKIASGTRGKNYLIVLTDGENDISKIDKYKNDDFEVIREPELIKKIEEEKFRKSVDIFAIGFGDDDTTYDKEFLEMICKASGNPNGYLHSKKDNISEIFDSLEEKIAREKYDYQLALKHLDGKKFRGNEREIELKIISPKPNQFSATGSFFYLKGEKYALQRVGPGPPLHKTLLLGLLIGIIVLLLVMIIIQLIIPLINNRIFIFQYVKKYKPAENEISKECQYCGDPINPGEKVVVRCKHIVHHLCWKDFDHMCPEYGQNCNDGKEAYFDLSDPFSRKNKIYYLNWALFGLIGGFLSWFIFVLIKDWDFIYRFADKLYIFFGPDELDEDYLLAFRFKIAPFLFVGFLMGFFLSSLFMYIEEYRNKNLFVYGKITLRGVIGGMVGFISILIGCVILILINRPASGSFFDWIPWILFGISIGYILSIKTTIVWKHGIIGGVISIIFCFIMIYIFAGELGEYATLVGFMIYGAGLGISIATVRSQSEHFFLKILQGKKSQGIIPVHKWMSYQGGHNEVYLGRGFACEIQLNWEQNNEEVATKHAKMYINNRSMPVLVSLVKGKSTHFNNRFDMNTGKEYELYNGVKFQIGETVFQYIEKD
ncbi:MAG: VWA domain-containing protein [Bacteroidales bacterium]|nr:VWA domain-containing protein [Bacteroidales bacterium]